jgi:hypothetical protein
MGRANSDNAATNGRLDDFFRVLAEPVPPAVHDANGEADYLRDHVFCVDSGAGANQIPWVGITNYGPQFQTAAKVHKLFVQLFTTFPDVALKPVYGAPRLYSPDGYAPFTIGIQTIFEGTQMAPWFPKGDTDGYYSPPLSDITPDRNHVTKLAACAVFSFDGQNRISQLAIYLDRYKLKTQLTPAASVEVSEVVSLMVKRLSPTHERVGSERSPEGRR